VDENLGNKNIGRGTAGEEADQVQQWDPLIETFYNHSSECHAVMSESSGGKFRYDMVNPATLKLYGKSREEVIGRTIEEVFGPEGAVELNKYLSACLAKNGSYRYERTQSKRIIEAIATPAPSTPGMPRRLVVTARDVTEQRNLELQLRQSQKMEALGQLTGGIAHDFNNLLQVIVVSADAISRRSTRVGTPLNAEEIARLSGACMRAADRAAALIHRLLAFSRRQPLAPDTLDANKLIGGMSDMLRRLLGESVQIEVVLAAGLWRTRVDPNQLESALLNLVINSRDAMPQGGRLTIETGNSSLDDTYAAEHLATPGQYVLVAVTDTGLGMSSETIAKAFEPFFTTKEMGYGTGLGLSMVYGFVKQSGGHVKIYSELGQGTVVKIYLPRYFDDASGTSESGSTSTPSLAAPGHRSEIILVVEDDEVVRDFSTFLLRELGFEPLEARDATSALRIIEQNERIDLLFTDVGLPGGISGRQLAEDARKLRPKLKVLFTTGYTRNAIVHNGTLDRDVDLISKPFTMDALSRKILAVLSET
jgi:PAS domain S-box-containing protein